MDWDYLQGIMVQLGFSEDWISLVMKCVNSVSFQVKVNGELLPPFHPSRGLQQGCLVSPYLFLLCGEGLSCMLKNYDGGWIDRGIRVGTRSPWISHLLFADDFLVFMKADRRSAVRLNEILTAYSLGSGKSANRHKSSVFFSPKCGASTKRGVKNVLQIQREALSEKYLGLPTAAGRITDQNFEHIVEAARSRVQGWDFRKASSAGKEVHIKSVVQALSPFSMSCFKLTKKVCKGFSSIMARYWWSSSIDKRSLHWVSWKELTKPKCQGGIGFRDLHLFNLALLGKHGGRFLTNPTSLCARVMKGMYFPDFDFQQASAPKAASATWRAIIAG